MHPRILPKSHIHTLSVLCAAAIVALSACGPSDVDAPHAESSVKGQSVVDATGPRLMTPVELQASLAVEDAVLINVCTSPDSGELPGTDLAIAFDKIREAAGSLPVDKNARIVLYCTGGGMSGTATNTLKAMGYTNVVDLDGGTQAWRKAGLPIGDRTQQLRRGLVALFV